MRVGCVNLRCVASWPGACNGCLCGCHVMRHRAGRELKYRHALKAVAFFGIAQALMPLIGFYAGQIVYVYISRASDWIAFILLFLIGINMIVSAIRNKEEKNNANPFSNC